MQSAPGEICPLQLSAPAIQAGSSFSFGVSIDGTPYAIECSTNLVTWSDVFTNNNPSQPFSFADTNTLTSSAQRFYCARRLQQPLLCHGQNLSENPSIVDCLHCLFTTRMCRFQIKLITRVLLRGSLHGGRPVRGRAAS